ncbi:ribose 5-phosphate isomerase B [Cryomorphaceae bacterium 1068]|nr:ribose 5-phosphate isomerase B [Cryomorphaceae bacterium 1068]
MNIAIGGDHAGYDLKKVLISHLENQDHKVEDMGPYSDESTDYPPFAHAVSDAVSERIVELGILICGSANGVAMTANKHSDIRCAICWDTELAELARAHNDANIVALPARFISDEKGLEIVDAFLSTEFEGGRHKRRVDQIPCT